MARKGQKAKQAEIFAKDGRKILGTNDFRDAMKKRVTERARTIATEMDAQASTKSLGTINLQVVKFSVRASKPDYNGKVTKVIEIGAVMPWSKAMQAVITDHLQEVMACEMKPKQILMNITSKRGDEELVLYDYPANVQAAAKDSVIADEDVKAALDDLCTCGHARREHMEDRFDNAGESTGIDLLDRGFGCNGAMEDKDDDCECQGFVPLKPGEKPTPMTGGETGEGDDTE